MRLLVLLLALAAAPAWASAPCPAPLQAGASDLGLASFQQDGEIRGAAIDVLRELASRTACPIEVAWYPRARLWVEFAAGHINLTGSSARTAERDRHGRFVPFVTTRFDLVLSRRIAGNYSSLAEFVERGVARLNLVRGIVYAPEAEAQLERLRKLGRIEVVNDYAMAFRKMASGRADATLAPMMIYSRYLAAAGLKGQVAVMAVAESAPMLAGAYFSRNMPPATHKAFADALLAMVADGTVARIYGNYVGAANGRSLVPEQGRATTSDSQSIP
ncbi:substrate-binding periplasmic protein [Pseudoduganella violaceinigra]|uniref:substrate-binding periplasmic protein n=1 Tax=Pseudoduganella violaceinigra TaxID=246602 RepID=UPI0004276F75|nr:transporter substrate-binding domain-containing protein [Pseudoduganella violaceinigra]